MRARIAVLISGHGTNLDALIRAIRDGRLDADIAAVICNRPQARGIEVARAAGIPVQVIDHREFATRAAFDAALQDQLASAAPDLVVLAGFMRVLTDTPVRAWEGRMINIHPSLLPAFRGLHTHARALAAGVRRHGASVHYVTPDLDGGPNIAQVELEVRPDDTASELAARLLPLEHQLLPTVVQWCIQGRVSLDGGCAMLDGRPLPATGVRLRAGPAGDLVRVSAA